MLLYPVYKQIKTRLATVGVKTFWYTGQYQAGSANQSLVVPAIYIQMPGESNTTFVGKEVKVAKKVPITIHYLSSAPFKGVDNAVQDAAIEDHEAKLKAIDKLLDGWNATDTDGQILTQQFTEIKSNTLQYVSKNLVSLITYQTDIFSRHLRR
jgi:hypothetical protein